MVEIRDSSKTVRRVVRPDDKSDRKVRVAGDVHPPVPFAEIPSVIAEIIGRQLAGIRALSAAGVELYQDELTALAEIARIVSSIATAHKKLAEDKPLEALSEDEIKAQLCK